MADFKDFGEKVEDIAKSVADKTGEVVEVQKLKSKIRSCKRKADNEYMHIGHIIHDKHMSGYAVENDCSDICETIDELNEEIVKLKRQVNEIKGYATCRNCGEAVDTEAMYCSKCGAQMY